MPYRKAVLPDLGSITVLDPEAITTSPSNILCGSKVGDYQSCPRKAWFMHHLGLYPNEKPRYFTIGSAFHKAAEIGLTMGVEFGALMLVPNPDPGMQVLIDQIPKDAWQDIQHLTEQEKVMLGSMYEAFFEVWNERPREIIALEQTMFFPLLSKAFEYWTIKADQVFQDDQGLWNGDIKTTSGYGPSTAKQYHDSLQTKLYGWIGSFCYPGLRGAKIFAVTKKAIRCIEETIPFDKSDFYQAELHLMSAVEDISLMENDHYFPRRCGACINSYGHVCPYFSLCMERKVTNVSYLQEVLNNWFTQRDPDEHLEIAEGDGPEPPSEDIA